jgi:CBS domain-containing protein
MHNHLDPATLNELERRILREALRQARSLQSRLTRDFAVGSASFGA